MKTKYIMAGLGGIAAVSCSMPSGDGETAGLLREPRPGTPVNVVLINLDDSGLGDFSHKGAVGYQTPAIDRMAAEGISFTNFYTAQPISGASRSALVTGCYSNRIGLTGAPMPNSPTGLADEEETIGELLQANGYQTALVGKWHIGDTEPFLPLRHGFDEFYGLPYSHDMWPGHALMEFPDLPLYDGDEVVDYIDTEEKMATLTTIYTERSLDFINRCNKEGKPFFLYLAHNMPHVPLAVSDKFKGKSEYGLYGDVMMELDWSVGEIVSELKDLGIADNTLVILTSDNGPWSNYGNHAGSSAGLREGKSTTFNGGVRVPCIFWMDGHTRPGSTCNALMSNIDLLPTIVSLTGAQMPRLKIDGVNYLPYLTGKDPEPARKYLHFYFSRNSLEAVTDGQYKLVFPHAYNSYEVYAPGMDGQGGRTARKEVTETELYDLRQDPGERRNIYSLMPDKVRELEQAADEIRKELGDDLCGMEGSGRRQPGRREGVPSNPFAGIKMKKGATVDFVQ